MTQIVRRRVVAAAAMAALVAAATPAAVLAAGQASPAARRFDFGTAASVAPGYVPVGVGDDARYMPERGYGWLAAAGGADTPELLVRDRGGPDDPLLRDFVFARGPRSFRIDAPAPGRYRLTVTAGDMDFGDHVLEVVCPGAPPLPALDPAAGEFVTLEAVVTVPAGDAALDLTFRSPGDNWVVNALTLEPLAADTDPTAAPRLTRKTFARAVPASTWGPVASWPDPTAGLLERYRAALAAHSGAFRPTGLSRGDYLKLIAGGVDFWKKKQDADTGAIVDPYRNVEFQYSTPAYAHAAATLAAYAKRKDLVEPAAKALDWSARTLADRKAASAHEDFFAPMVAHAIRLLKPLVPAERAARWEADVRRFDPYVTYRMRPGANNWNIVSLSGEALFQRMGLRPETDTYVAASLATQGRHFDSPYGLYTEGPMAYDHFPRLWVGDLVGRGYDGPHAAVLAEVLRRGAVTSLFLQSPWGELPAGGRSAHHQWNEAEQCVTFEVFAARALESGDADLAAAYKRAARLALASMRRWVRRSGDLQIVKNWVDPERGHAFESYSAHSQYGLLPLSMLAIAYEHAGPTETVAEKPAPADVGGFLVPLEKLHKVVANAGGTYVEVDTTADQHYDATGLIRIHHPAVNPQIGPSDSVVANPSYRRPDDSPRPPQTTGVGIAWRTSDGAWRHLGALDRAALKRVTVSDVAESPGRVAFTVRYDGDDLGGPSSVEERYVVTPAGVELTTTLAGYDGPRRYVWPVLADDGRDATRIAVRDGVVSVSADRRGARAQTFRPVGAASVRVEEAKYPNHNGWARLAVAEYPAARTGPVTLVIAPGP